MNYYSHHIGDFDKATRHLTRIERSIYRDLIELYYDTEKPLTLDRAALCRKIIATSSECSTAVEQVLNEFFNETPDGWYHVRCEIEIEKYRSNQTAQARAGKASAAAKALKAQQALNRRSTPAQQTLNNISTDVEHPLNVRTTDDQPTVNREPGTVAREPGTANQEPPTPVAVDPTLGSDMGRERPKAPRAHRLPADFSLTPEWMQHAQGVRPDWNPLQVADVFATFRDHWTSKSGKDAAKLDWLATWRNWCRREKSFSREAQAFLTPGQRKAAVTKQSIDEWLAEGEDANAIKGEFERG